MSVVVRSGYIKGINRSVWVYRMKGDGGRGLLLTSYIDLDGRGYVHSIVVKLSV